MKLYGSTGSAYVRKVRVVLAEKKLEYQFEPINAWAPGSPVVALNPLGKVPVLELKPGELVHDSRVISEYLDTLSPVGKLLPASGRDRLEVRLWEATADGVLDAAVQARLEATWEGRTDSQRCQAWIDRQMAKVHDGMTAMERKLGDKPFCCGIHLTLADVALGCALGWISFRFPELAWREAFPALASLQERLEQRPSFADTMPA